MGVNQSNPNAAQRVRPVEGLKVSATYLKNVTTSSQTFADLIGSSIPSNVGSIEVFNNSGNTITFNSGTAVAGTNAEIPTGFGYPFFGRDSELDTIEFIAGSTSAMSIIVHVSI
jgi:hypothetical protein